MENRAQLSRIPTEKGISFVKESHVVLSTAECGD